MAEQLLSSGSINEHLIRHTDPKEARVEIGLTLLKCSGKIQLIIAGILTISKIL